MKRFFFYLVMFAAVVGSSIVVLFMNEWGGLELMKGFVNGIIKGTYKPGTTASDFMLYGMAAFFVLNAAIVLTMLLILLFTGFNLNKKRRFYRISIWYIVSALILTGVWGYMHFGALHRGFKPINHLLIHAIPIGAAIIVGILALVFHRVGRRR
jgi:hypothetical protein